MNAGLRCLALTDIDKEAHIADQIAFVIVHRRDAGPGREALAATALLPKLAFPAAMLVQRLQNLAVKGIAVLTLHQGCRQLIDHLLREKTGDARKVFVYLHDVASRVGDHDSPGGVLKYRRSHAQAVLGTALLADIASQTQQPQKAPLGAPHQRNAHFQRTLASICLDAIKGCLAVIPLAAQNLNALG